MPDPANAHLRGMAERVADAFATLEQTRAVMLIGSAAENHADFYSDLDMCVYYNELPPVEALTSVRESCGGSKPVWSIGDRATGAFAEAFLIDGVECQIAHATTMAWEVQMATVREKLEVNSPLQKALSGMLTGVALRGSPLINEWKSTAAVYPDALARAMVERYLTFFPVWYLSDRFIVRDADLWLHQIVIEAEQNILGVLAGLNRLYYTTFQFKRLSDFVGQMTIAPSNLAERINSLLYLEPNLAIPALAQLVQETIDLVDQHMPGMPTDKIRGSLDKKQQSWAPAVVDLSLTGG